MKNSFFLIVTILFFFVSCQETKKNDEKDEIKQKQEEQSFEPDIHEASELAEAMKKIESELKIIKENLIENSNIPNLDFQPQDFIEAEATDHDVKNPDFTSYTVAFHQATEKFNTIKTQQQYNLLINACVNCHNQFCTGPIKRIKKLEL